MAAIADRPPNAKILWDFMMTLDGFVAGAGHDMNWMTNITMADGVIENYMATTGAVLTGRKAFDGAIRRLPPWGGRWKGPIFVLTHHPEDAEPAPDVTFLSAPVEEAAAKALQAAAGKNLMIFSAKIGAQLLDRGLIDEIDIHIAPVLLGDGIRLYENPGGKPVRLDRLDVPDPNASQRVRYRPV
jgi:dihydrofolate reductase